MMQKISVNGKTKAFESDVRQIAKHLVEDASVIDIKVDNGKRTMTYDNGDVLTIEPVDKVIGTKAGDICQICKSGELKDYGGCASCENCGAQLKCGL